MGENCFHTARKVFDMNQLILERLKRRMADLAAELGYSDPVVRKAGTISEIYVVKTHALQLEIDWRENDLFLYAVYLRDGKLPGKSVIYSYPDGHWCRKYLEEVCHTKRAVVRDRERRYSEEYLFERFDFYVQMIRRHRERLAEFLAD